MSSQYELNCTDCPFESLVVGEFEDAIDAIEAHRREEATGPLDHFVNVHCRDESPTIDREADTAGRPD